MYTFKLNIGSLANPVKGDGYILVHPITTDNGIIKYRDEDYFAVIRKKLKKPLLFKGSDYYALKNLYDQEIEYIELKIYYNDQERFYGYLMMTGDWDEDQKTCALNCEPVDNYSELLKNKDIETNVVGFAVNSVNRYYESIVIELTLPCFLGSRAEAEFYYDPNGQVSEDPYDTHPDWTYYVENGFIDCGGGLKQYQYRSTYLNFPFSGYTQSIITPSIYLKPSLVSETVIRPLNRCAKMFDVVKDLINEADDAISIDEETYSDYINNLANKIYNLYIMDKSDAKRNDSENPATFEMIKLQDVLDLYLKLFRLSYKIDANKNFFFVRREELNEIDYAANPQYDLTTYRDKNYTLNQKKYTIESSKKPSKQILKFEETYRSFSKSFIDYQTYQEYIDEINFSNFYNEIDFLVTDPEEISDNGFCLLACNTSNSIINYANLGTNEIVNGAMSPQSIIKIHWSDDRPFNAGIVDRLYPLSFNKFKEKKVIYKNIPYYDIDIIDFDYYIKTELGLLEAQELEISFDFDFATLTANL